MTRTIHGRALAIAVLGILCSTAAQADVPKTPAGVYLHFDVEYTLNVAKLDGAPQKKKDKYLKTYLRNLLDNRALAGVTVGVHWDTLESGGPPVKNVPPYTCSDCQWDDLDDVFDVVNSMPGKTVQLIVTPGFDSPGSLMTILAAQKCDGLFANASGVSPDCGTVEFIDFNEQKRSDQWPQKGTYTLPVPWSSQYQDAWFGFLGALSQHVAAQPRLVAIAIAGPVAGSDEFILPTTQNGRDVQKGIHSKTQIGGVPADTAWTALIKNYDRDKHHTYYSPKSDDIFVDLWTTAIQQYESKFPGLTIFLGPDAGHDYPTFGKTVAIQKNQPTLLSVDCSNVAPNDTISCQAKTQIIANFQKASGLSQKGTQVGGMTASSDENFGNIGVAGVKLLTASYKGLWPQGWAIGGAEFDHAVSNLDDHVGCLKSDPECKNTPMTVELAAARVLEVFFYHTAVAQNFGSRNTGNETMNYLDIPAEDVQYMEGNQCWSSASDVPPLYAQIARADYYLLAMSGKKPATDVLLNVCAAHIKPPIPPCTKTRGTCK